MLVIKTTRPLVRKYFPCPSTKKSSLLLARRKAATRIIINPKTVYKTTSTHVKRESTSNSIKFGLKNLKNNQCKRKLSKTCSPIRCFKCPLTSSTIRYATWNGLPDFDEFAAGQFDALAAVTAESLWFCAKPVREH